MDQGSVPHLPCIKAREWKKRLERADTLEEGDLLPLVLKGREASTRKAHRRSIRWLVGEGEPPQEEESVESSPPPRHKEESKAR